MSKKLAIIAAALLAATPAAAQNATCIEPAPVTAIKGEAATAQELRAARDQVAAFMSQSEIYQTCIASDLDAKRKAAAATNTAFDPQLQQVAHAKIAANQLAKDLAAKNFNTQFAAFKQRQAR